MKMVEAKISCSAPEKPRAPGTLWKGKCGESAQMSSGTLAMRVSVMEFGRFTRAESRVQTVDSRRAKQKPGSLSQVQPFCHKDATRMHFPRGERGFRSAAGCGFTEVAAAP